MSEKTLTPIRSHQTTETVGDSSPLYVALERYNDEDRRGHFDSARTSLEAESPGASATRSWAYSWSSISSSCLPTSLFSAEGAGFGTRYTKGSGSRVKQALDGLGFCQVFGRRIRNVASQSRTPFPRSMLAIMVVTMILVGSIYSYIDTESLMSIASEESTESESTLPSIYRPYFSTLSIPPFLSPNPNLESLSNRLQDFLSRPILSYEDMMEENEIHCPSKVADGLVDPYQLRDEAKFWKKMSKKTIAKKRSELVTWLEGLSAKGKVVVGSENMGGGKGIVLTGGNKDTTERIITLVKILRRYRCNLPIEVFHFEDEMTNENQRMEIEGLGAEIRLIQDVEKDGGAWKNFQIKGLAMVQSSFREILYLDSDNIPLRDPTYLFDALHYKSHTAVFWPDISKDHPRNAIWRLIGEPCTLEDWTFESGQILIDKAGNDGLNLAALWIASGMMEDKEFWFRMCGGDKDTFRWAFRVLDLKWGRSLRWMSALGFENSMNGGRFCGHTMLQYDITVPDNMEHAPPLFVHSNLLKHLSSSILQEGQIFTHLKRLKDDTYHTHSGNNAHMYIYDPKHLGGYCLDLELQPRTTSLQALEAEDQGVEVIRLEDVEGDVFRGFEGLFLAEGGKVGGW